MMFKRRVKFIHLICIFVLTVAFSYAIPQGYAEAVGPSMNPPNQYVGINHGKQITITETSQNSAIDDEGNVWIFDKTWKMKTNIKKHVDDETTSRWLDRNHSWFNVYKKGQELLAEQILNKLLKGKSIHNDSFYFSEFESSIDKIDDGDLQNKIDDEKIKAEKKFKRLFVLKINR